MTTTTTAPTKAPKLSANGKRLGRPPRGSDEPTKPRDVFVVCSSKGVVKSIPLSGITSDVKNEIILEKAISEFKKNHPEAKSVATEGPFFIRHGKQVSGKPRDSINSLSLEDNDLDKEKFEGIYNEWNVIVRSVVGHPEALYIAKWVNHLSDPNKIKPTSKFVKREAVSAIKPL